MGTATNNFHRLDGDYHVSDHRDYDRGRTPPAARLIYGVTLLDGHDPPRRKHPDLMLHVVNVPPPLLSHEVSQTEWSQLRSDVLGHLSRLRRTRSVGYLFMFIFFCFVVCFTPGKYENTALVDANQVFGATHGGWIALGIAMASFAVAVALLCIAGSYFRVGMERLASTTTTWGGLVLRFVPVTLWQPGHGRDSRRELAYLEFYETTTHRPMPSVAQKDDGDEPSGFV